VELKLFGLHGVGSVSAARNTPLKHTTRLLSLWISDFGWKTGDEMGFTAESVRILDTRLENLAVVSKNRSAGVVTAGKLGNFRIIGRCVFSDFPVLPRSTFHDEVSQVCGHRSRPGRHPRGRRNVVAHANGVSVLSDEEIDGHVHATL
jgi:hypothetical protein